MVHRIGRQGAGFPVLARKTVFIANTLQNPCQLLLPGEKFVWQWLKVLSLDFRQQVV
jgi:hypothetical protein